MLKEGCHPRSATSSRQPQKQIHYTSIKYDWHLDFQLLNSEQILCGLPWVSSLDLCVGYHYEFCLSIFSSLVRTYLRNDCYFPAFSVQNSFQWCFFFFFSLSKLLCTERAVTLDWGDGLVGKALLCNQDLSLGSQLSNMHLYSQFWGCKWVSWWLSRRQ